MGKNKWIWITIAIVFILVLVIGVYAYASKSAGGGDSQQPTTPSSPSNGNPPSTGAPTQVLKKYTCETKKVCQGRGGYANWVKTGSQRNCNVSNVSQALCLSDCLGTCYVWE